MRHAAQIRFLPADRRRERGVVLVLALIALITLLLAAVGLTRSVDTSTVIAGNLAFRQAATASADAGLERAVAWMRATSDANVGKDPFSDSTHAFNGDSAKDGYYSSADPALNLMADATWANNTSSCAEADASGNRVCYIIQRMCRDANQKLSDTDCLFSDAENDTGSKRVKSASEAGAKVAGKIPLNRVTIRVTGPRNTVSYVQAFVY